MMEKKKAEHLVKHIKIKVFGVIMPNIKNIDCILFSNQIFVDYANGLRCSINHQFIDMYDGRYGTYNYTYKNNEIIARDNGTGTQEFSEIYKNTHPEIFAVFLYILQNRENVFRIIEEATYLYKHTKYHEIVCAQAKTFLLCNFRNCIFCRDIANIIAHKILFFIFFLRKLKKKK